MALLCNRARVIKGRRHTFPERGLRPGRLGYWQRKPKGPKAHVPREGFETVWRFHHSPWWNAAEGTRSPRGV